MGSGDTSKLVRIPANRVCHVFEPVRIGQLRGVSILAPILAWLRDVGDFNGNVLERMKIANLFMGFIKQSMPDGFDDADPVTGKPLVDAEPPMATMMPATMQQLLPGEDIEFANPPEAGTTFSEYARTADMRTAAGQDLPYELMSGDIKDVSDRTLRVVINEFRRLAEQRQWQIIIPQFCQRVSDAFAEFALLAEKISPDEYDDVRRVEHSPHGWAHIHPVQDPQGKKLEIEMGTRSRSSVISERGDDPDAVDAERAADAAREESLGLPTAAAQDTPQIAPAAPPGQQTGKQDNTQGAQQAG